jgi:hypothetical protein
MVNYIRLGLTESTLYYLWILKHKKLCKDFEKKNIEKEMLNWLYTTSGFYDKRIKGNYFDFDNEYKKILNSNTYTQYMFLLDYYINKCDNFVFLVHKLPIYLSKYKNEIDQNYFKLKPFVNQELDHLYNVMDKKRVLIVSSFAELIKERIDSGDCNKIFLKFPHIVSSEAFTTPYTFFNNGQEGNILETTKKMQNQIEILKDQFDIAIVSCGAYGALISGFISEQLKKDSYMAGGKLNSMFGICSGRFPYNDSLPNKELWLKQIPEKYRPKDYLKIENGCYW